MGDGERHESSLSCPFYQCLVLRTELFVRGVECNGLCQDDPVFFFYMYEL